MHLAERLPAGSFAEAAAAGLQDSAPRAGLLSLHARMEGVEPDSWEHPALAQVWGPRQAVWLVPRDAVAAFTLGRLPRDEARRRQIDRIADEALRGGKDPERRAGAATGRYLVRWDERTTELIPIEPPSVDVEAARRELALRYLRWFGEGMRARFAQWAGIEPGDARETLRHVPPVDLVSGPPATGVRLLPRFDPYGYGRPAPATPHRELVGTILVDGRREGTWARQARRVTLRPRTGRHLDRIEEEARRLEGPLGGRVTVATTRPEEPHRPGGA
jgi:hypothetical protein